MSGRGERLLGELVGAAGRYWPVSAAVVSAVGSFGLPDAVDTTNRWVLFAAGFVVFSIAFLMGKRSGRDESAKTARETAQRDFETKAKDLRHSYDLKLVEHDRAHDREIQELRSDHDHEVQVLNRSHDREVARLRKMLEDADRDGEADAARARELEAFKRSAEIGLGELERIKNEFECSSRSCSAVWRRSGPEGLGSSPRSRTPSPTLSRTLGSSTGRVSPWTSDGTTCTCSTPTGGGSSPRTRKRSRGQLRAPRRTRVKPLNMEPIRRG